MTEKLEAEGKVEPAVVLRIVPGKLVYVEPKRERHKVYAFKLNKLVICHPDGTRNPYRGESLTRLLNVGATVGISNLDSPEEDPTLFVDATNVAGTTWGSSLSSFASKYFKLG